LIIKNIGNRRANCRKNSKLNPPEPGIKNKNKLDDLVESQKSKVFTRFFQIYHLQIEGKISEIWKNLPLQAESNYNIFV